METNLKLIVPVLILAFVAIYLIISANIVVYGLCIFGTCNETIKITSIDYPKSVKYYQNFKVGFTVANSGNNIRNDCILHFAPYNREIDQNLSEPFSISANEKIDIILEFSGFGTGIGYGNYFGDSRQMSAWVVCNNIESHRIQFETVLEHTTQEEMDKWDHD